MQPHAPQRTSPHPTHPTPSSYQLELRGDLQQLLTEFVAIQHRAQSKLARGWERIAPELAAAVGAETGGAYVPGVPGRSAAAGAGAGAGAGQAQAQLLSAPPAPAPAPSSSAGYYSSSPSAPAQGGASSYGASPAAAGADATPSAAVPDMPAAGGYGGAFGEAENAFGGNGFQDV